MTAISEDLKEYARILAASNNEITEYDLIDKLSIDIETARELIIILENENRIEKIEIKRPTKTISQTQQPTAPEDDPSRIEYYIKKKEEYNKKTFQRLSIYVTAICLIGIFFIYIYNNYKTKDETDINLPHQNNLNSTQLEKFNHGKQLVNNIISNKKGKLYIYGIAAENPKLMLAFVANEIWEGFSSKEKDSISFYISTITKSVTENPKPYIDIPESAPFFDQAVINARNVCPSCWVISGPQDNLVLGEKFVQNR